MLSRVVLCLTFCLTVASTSATGSNMNANMPAVRENQVRTALTIIGAVAGLGIGIFGSISFLSYSPLALSLADRLYVAVPTTLAFAVTSTLAARWIANRSLSFKPSLLLSPLLGAGLGAAGCGFVGAISFPVLVTLGTSARIGVSSGSVEGIWVAGMGIFAGALWGAIAGVPLGAVSVPLVSLYMRF